MSRAAQELGQPSQLWYAGVIKTILAMSDGRFGDAESLIDETMGYGRRAQAWDAEASRLLALFVLRREQGRLDELEDEVRRMLVTHPGYRSLRCMLLVLLLEIGRGRRPESCSVSWLRMTAIFPKDNEWLFVMILLAEAALTLEDDAKLLVLYEALASLQ